MGSSQKIYSGVLWSTICNIVNAVYGFIAVPLLINYFGKSEYGLIGLAMSINVYMQLMDMGLNSTNVRFFSTWLSQGKHEKIRKGFQTSLAFYSAVGILNAIVLIIISFFSGSIFNVTPEQDIILKHLLYILAVSAFCSWFSSCFDQIIKATENIAWLQIRTLFTKVLMIIVLVATICGGLNIEWYYALTCLATLSIVPLSIGKIRKDTPFVSFKPQWDKHTFKEMFPYMMNIFSFSLFQFSFYNLRPVFLGIQGTMESVADYRVLNGIVGVVTMVSGSLTGVLLPSTSKVVAQNDKDSYYRLAYDGTKYLSLLIAFCCFGMMAIGKDALTLYVGPDYLCLIPWLNLWLLCTLGSHNQAISSLILAGDDIRAITYSSIAASVIGLVSAWFLIPRYQVGGVCIAFAVYNIIQLAFYYIYYWPKKMNIDSKKVLLKSFLPATLLGLALYVCVNFICGTGIYGGNHIVSLFMSGAVFSIVYIAFTWFVILNRNDREFLVKLIKKQ